MELYSWHVQVPVEERTRSVKSNQDSKSVSYGVHHILDAIFPSYTKIHTNRRCQKFPDAGEPTYVHVAII